MLRSGGRENFSVEFASVDNQPSRASPRCLAPIRQQKSRIRWNSVGRRGWTSPISTRLLGCWRTQRHWWHSGVSFKQGKEEILRWSGFELLCAIDCSKLVIFFLIGQWDHVWWNLSIFLWGRAFNSGFECLFIALVHDDPYSDKSGVLARFWMILWFPIFVIHCKYIVNI